MGDSLYVMAGQLKVPVEPTGVLATEGWMPCTFVKVVKLPPSKTSGAVAAVDRSDGTGTIAGLLITGPQHRHPFQKISDMWTTDTRQRPGGETRADWTAVDASANVMSFDQNKLLDHMGSGCVTMACGSDGWFKTYVFEVRAKDVRHSNGTTKLVYEPGDALFVSENGLLTKEKESNDHVFLGYAVYRSGSDSEGDFVIFGTAMAMG